MLLWTFVYKFLSGHIFSLLLSIHLGVELLGLMVTLFFTNWGTGRILSKAWAPYYIPTSYVWGGSNVSTPLPFHIVICLFYYSLPSRCQWYRMVVLICISLTAVILSIFSCVYSHFNIVSYRILQTDASTTVSDETTTQKYLWTVLSLYKPWGLLPCLSVIQGRRKEKTC